MPLKVGTKWSYSVSTARRQSTPNIVVDRALAVGNGPGFELSGPLGLTRMAWNGRLLVASQLAGTGFKPPIPMLDPSLPEKPVVWNGEIRGPLSSAPAQATLTHEMSTTLLAGVRQPAIKTTLSLKLSGHHLDLLTWWVRGIGIAEQTQRTDGVQDVELSWLSGPTPIGPETRSGTATGTGTASKASDKR
jgi:hypothetical protein